MSGLLVDAVVVDDVRINSYFLGFEFFCLCSCCCGCVNSDRSSALVAALCIGSADIILQIENCIKICTIFKSPK